MDIILMLLGTILLLVLLYFVTEMPKWNKRHYRRIYKSPGKKRTARKSMRIHCPIYIGKLHTCFM